MKFIHPQTGQQIALRSISDKEYDKISRMIEKPFDVCPTCETTWTEIPGSGGVKEWRNGHYHFMGEEHDCDCQLQIALRVRYTLAKIGDEYQRLDWAEYPDGIAKEAVEMFLDKWKGFKRLGMGLEFGGPLGVGKTFAATHIGKELIKRAQRVYFVYFRDMIGTLDLNWADRDETYHHLKESTFLIIDDVVPAITDSQREFFTGEFESIIRHRTNHSLPTIITTNMTQEALNKDYPRIYSLLAAKQYRVDLSGEDARKIKVAKTNMDLIENDEVRPIT